MPNVSKNNPPQCNGKVGDWHEPTEMQPSGVPEGRSFECPACGTEITV